jgi:hypothetical protein
MLEKLTPKQQHPNLRPAPAALAKPTQTNLAYLYLYLSPYLYPYHTIPTCLYRPQNRMHPAEHPSN